MKHSYPFSLAVVFCISILFVIQLDTNPDQVAQQNDYAEQQFDGPEELAKFHHEIRTPEGLDLPEYKAGQRVKEYYRIQNDAVARKRNGRTQSNGVLEWIERGPNNVPGRTRGLIVDPDDPTKETWYAGSASGGVWKTTNAGLDWTLITPDLPNLATTVLAMAPSNTNVIYMGTGEGFGNLDAVRGDGMFKSTNKGQTWTYLSASGAMGSVNRIIIDPTNENIVVVAANSGIYRSTNGGTSWVQVSDRTFVQDLKATPGNFTIQYAAQKFVGVLKSTDAGVTWNISSTGLSPTATGSLGSGRVEIDVSPVNPNRLFASAQSNVLGTGSALYISDNAGELWVPVNTAFNNAPIDFLGGQGWYDNTIACDPFFPNVVYFGGVNLFKAELAGTSNTLAYGVEDNTDFLSLVNFSATQFGGRLEVGSGANKSIEVRFGPGKSQKAHRFTVPVTGGTNGDGGAGIPDNQYTYQDYVEVPFQVWEVDNSGNDVRQLMVSFRDQQRDGQFNLNVRDDVNDPQLLTAREYLYIHYLTYQDSPATELSVTGGQVIERMYFFWPTLLSGTWNPSTLPEVEFKILVINTRNANLTVCSDAYGQLNSVNRFINYGVDFHPDQHNLIMIPVTANTFRILAANDGGIFISNTSTTPGINTGDWTMRGNTYRTSQFYGADKRPGFNEYIGGMQDNGTWKSPAGGSASANTNYFFNIGGDGFEVLWNNLDDKKLIGGSQGNNFRRSINGGSSWTNATNGLSGNHPFISKLANSRANPDRIYTLSSAGVFRSENFGESWTLTPITEKWGSSTSLMDVEVSQANANIVWAGSGMVNTGTLRNLHVSMDGGASFTPTNNFTAVTMGGITKLASHPTEENTAFALFSFSGRPKVLRTTDLGQTWEDISGLENGAPSTNGFPNVAVYCLYVRPDNPDIIWVGTEIGIVESQDNGQTWSFITDFPSVSVWDMKGQDDQVVIATHGRGIWTATIESPQVSVNTPEIIASGTTPKEKLIIKVNIAETFDKVEFYDNGLLLGSLTNVNPSQIVVEIGNLTPGLKNIKTISYKGNAPYHSKTYPIELLDILSVEDTYGSYFSSTNDLSTIGFFIQPIPGASSGERGALRTNSPYSNSFNYSALIRHPIRVAAENATVVYEDIAIVEPGADGSTVGSSEFKDYVIVEATKNGLDWLPLSSGYDARLNSQWLTAFNAGSPGSKSMFVNHEINMLNTFQAGDTLLIRYRMVTNATVNGWGWALNYVVIQQAPTGLESSLSEQHALAIYPNPANDKVTIDFTLNRPSEISLEIVDITGRSVMSKRLGAKDSGKHSVNLNITELDQSSYVLLVKTREGDKQGRLVINR